MRSKTATPKAAPKATPPGPAKRPRKGLALSLGLVTLIALGFAFWSWHQSSRPGAVHLQAGLDAQAAHQDAQAEQEWLVGTHEDPAFPDDYAQLGDLYLGQQRFDYEPSFSRLFHNNGDGTFADVTHKAGLDRL